MDFFEMDFRELFKEKHGENAFNEICNIINEEDKNIDNDEIALVFKIAFLEYFGLNDMQIEELLQDTQLNEKMNITNINKIHKKSIDEIKKYIDDALKELE